MQAALHEVNNRRCPDPAELIAGVEDVGAVVDHIAVPTLSLGSVQGRDRCLAGHGHIGDIRTGDISLAVGHFALAALRLLQDGDRIGRAVQKGSGKDEGTVRGDRQIVAGVVLAGELSLASAISSSDWVSSHEQYGRNR